MRRGTPCSDLKSSADTEKERHQDRQNVAQTERDTKRNGLTYNRQTDRQTHKEREAVTKKQSKTMKQKHGEDRQKTKAQLD